MEKKKGYGQFCPVAKAAEIVAERWTPLVLRELLSGSTRFNDLRKGVPLMSPSLLSKRLKELEGSGLIEKRKPKGGKVHEYHLTEAGEELRPVVDMLGFWGRKWAQAEIHRDDLDPDLLMWDIRRGVDTAAVSAERLVAQFDVTGVPTKKSRWWLVFAEDDVDLCLKPPGFDVDLYVSSSIRTLTDIWMGYARLSASLKTGKLTLEGKRPAVRGFAKWFALSPYSQPEPG